MACQVEQIADCGDISSLARALFIPDKEDAIWLSQCAISVSSCGSLLAVGFKNRLCILTAQWISSSETNTFIISWSGAVPSEVTAILAVPICPSNHSSQNGPDWFCVVVGFLNGSVGFYTNTGHLLLNEKFDDKPVMKISCHTGTYGTLPDDFCILYPTSECIVTGSSLFQTLRYAKAQLAKVQAGLQSEYTVDGRSISVHRWTFTEQAELSDAVVAGLELKNTYDHLLAASTYGGYDTWYRSIPPHNSLILTAGEKPYIGFHYALEGGTAPPLQDVARAVANKIKSALPGWLGGGSTETTTKAEPHVRSEALSLRGGLRDARRGARTALSPDRSLVAVADSVGRVAVLHISKGHVVRLFKGYRDAQVAFVQVFETDGKKPQLSVIKDIRRALFLVIYNPKKGLIDIRLMNRGNRVAVFTATKNGKLLYNTSGMVGAEASYTKRKLNLPQEQCVLMDPDGKLKRFSIPFFFALEGEQSDRSKDLHILRDLRDYIKKTSHRDEQFATEILNRASELETVELRKHCLEMLIRNYEVSPTIVMSCLEVFWDSLGTSDLDQQTQKCKNYFVNLTLATLFYRYINGESVDDMNDLITKIGICDDNTDVKIEEDCDKLSVKSRKLNLLENDSGILERMLSLAQERDYKEHQHARVTFADKAMGNYKLFVYSFDLEENYENEFLIFNSDLSEEKLNNLAADTFKSLFKLDDYTKLSEYVTKCKINPKDLMNIVIVHMMNMSLDDIHMDLIQQFIQVIYFICNVSNEATYMAYNKISEWWQATRDMLVEMPCPLRSMIVAMACRVVAQLFEDDSGVEEEAWETVTTENAKWSILIGKLEDISILSIILYFKESFKIKSLPKLPPATLDVNLKYIYSEGKGSVTELIAKWLCTMGVIPEAIIANELSEKESLNTSIPDIDDSNYDAIFVENNREYLQENSKIFKWFNLLRKQFPYSTAADNIIANMSWEYALSWHKDPQKTDLLAAVVQCLKNVKDEHVGLGLCIMIWVTHIKDMFKASCRLINKVGKFVKERLCLQDVGLTEKSMLNFLDLTTEYLGHFMHRATSLTNKEKRAFLYEKIWEQSSPCLLDVAQDTNTFNIDVLDVHYQMALSINLQCQLNIKVSKHLQSLYDVDLSYFFEALTINATDGVQMNFKALENKLRPTRMKFVNKVIMAALDLITYLEEDEAQGVLDPREATHWIDKVHILGRLWNIEKDFLYRQEVIGLFRLGYDDLVRLGRVSEMELVVPALVAVGAQRLKRHLLASANPAEWLSAVPTDLAQYIERTECDSTIATGNTSIESTKRIISQALGRIYNSDKSPTNTSAIRLAELIVKGCETIKQDEL